MTRPIRREMKRRAAVEPVIGHVKAEHRMGRNYLKGRDGDRSNAVLAAAGYNFCLLLRWLEAFARPVIDPLSRPLVAALGITRRSENILHGRPIGLATSGRLGSSRADSGRRLGR